MPLTRQLAAIMFTDIVGYTALMGKDSHKALELVRQSKGIQKPLVEKHNGNWIKEMGDGVLAQFITAIDAVNCALEIQRTSREGFDGNLRIGIHLGDITIENNDVFGDGVNIASRLESITDPGGIYISESVEKAIRGQSEVQARYLGEIKLKNVDYGVRTYAVQGIGLPVPEVGENKELSGHLWAELQRRDVIRAAAVYIFISLLLILLIPYARYWFTLPDLTLPAIAVGLLVGFPIALYLAWNYERSPEGYVKTTSRESWQNPLKAGKRKPLTSNYVIAGLLLVIVSIYFFPNQKGPVVESINFVDKSIAVLPFEDISPEGDQQWFSDGVTSAILSHLTLIEELKVKSKTSVQQYRSSTKTVPQIALELGVSYVLEGDIQLYNDSVRIVVQLIDAISDHHIWADSYDHPFQGIFSIQSDIAKKVAEVLKAEISSETIFAIEEKPTHSPEAYALYLKALDTSQDVNDIISLLDQAIVIDSGYANAYALKGLTWLWGVGALWGDGKEGAQKVMSNTYPLLNKALELDPQNSLAHYALGALQLWYLWNFEEAEKEYSIAWEIDPTTPYLASNYCEMLIAVGRFEEALTLAKEAYDMEYIPWPLPDPLIFTGNYAEAETIVDGWLSTETVHPGVNGVRVLFYLGRYQDAIQYSERILNSHGTAFKDANTRLLAYAAMSYISLGQPKKANEIIDVLEDKSNASLVGVSPCYHTALVYSHKGEIEKAFTLLNTGYRTHEIEMYHLKTEPAFEPLRKDPRWQEMVKKMGFPK